MDTSISDLLPTPSPIDEPRDQPRASFEGWSQSVTSAAQLRSRQTPSSAGSVPPSSGSESARGTSSSNRLHDSTWTASGTDKTVPCVAMAHTTFLADGTPASSTARATATTTTPSFVPTPAAATVTTAAGNLGDAATLPPSSSLRPSSSTKDATLDTDFTAGDKGPSPVDTEANNSEFSCNICFDTSTGPVLTLCGHLYCWSCLHQWLEAQRQNPTCPVCKAGCAQDKIIPIYGRGKEQLDPRSTTPKRPAGQRPEPLRNAGAGFALATGQYGGSYSGNLGTNGAVQTPAQAYMSRLFFMLGTLILVGILLYPSQ
ncbi:unnamed protein product [Mortierella alpina]